MRSRNVVVVEDVEDIQRGFRVTNGHVIYYTCDWEKGRYFITDYSIYILLFGYDLLLTFFLTKSALDLTGKTVCCLSLTLFSATSMACFLFSANQALIASMVSLKVGISPGRGLRKGGRFSLARRDGMRRMADWREMRVTLVRRCRMTPCDE